MLHGVRDRFLVLNPSDHTRRAPYTPPCNQLLQKSLPFPKPGGDRAGRKPRPVTSATAPHLALGPRPPPAAPPPPAWQRTPGARRTHPAYPGVGHVYRLRRVVLRGSGLPRAQSHSRLAPLIRCHRRHRRWARRAAGIALHRPPWPSPPPSASAKGPAPVAAATATAATGSPGRLRAARPARTATSGLPRPGLSRST